MSPTREHGLDDQPDGEPDPLIGTTVGGHHIESLLGVGGMGRVYTAVGDNGEDVALKLIREDLGKDEVFRRRFEREARVSQRITNPHVVPILDSGEHDGVPYLVQRLIRGGSLEQMLDREVRLELAVALRICGDVADGLDALFAGGLVHRDVKPGNVLLESDGRALITDFGLAKDSDGTNLTRAGQALGSLDYMAPEQIRAEPVGASTDVYALGCVVFHCLCGAPPFSASKGMRVLWAQLQDEPPDPCAELSEAPAELGPAILRALEKDPAARPQSAGEYARLLYRAARLPERPSGAAWSCSRLVTGSCQATANSSCSPCRPLKWCSPCAMNWKLGSLSVYCLALAETRISPPPARLAIRAASRTLRPYMSSPPVITAPL